MVIKEVETKKHSVEKYKNGKGTVELYQYLSSADFRSSMLGFYQIVIPAGAKIGKHIHDKSEAIYLLIEGSGIAIDDENEIPVSEGDLIFIHSGQCHGLINNSDKPLKIISLAADEVKKNFQK